jgi:gas vesicle protein
MTEQNNEETKKPDWKKQTYLFGGIVGAIMGVLSAYLFAKEAEDESENERPKIPPTTLLGLALSALSLIRQIAETGKKDKERKK